MTRPVGFTTVCSVCLLCAVCPVHPRPVTWFLAAAAGPGQPLTDLTRHMNSPAFKIRATQSATDFYIPDPRHPCRCQKKEKEREKKFCPSCIFVCPGCPIVLTMASDVTALEAEVKEFKLQVGPSLLAYRHSHANPSFCPARNCAIELAGRPR